MKFNEIAQGMQWILKNGVKENVNNFFHSITRKREKGV